jgi:hypothetical protein
VTTDVVPNEYNLFEEESPIILITRYEDIRRRNGMELYLV